MSQKLISNWITSELFGALNKKNLNFIENPIKPENLGLLVKMISDGTISGRIAKEIFSEMFETGGDPKNIVDKKGLVQNSNQDEIQKIVVKILSIHAEKVQEYKAGKEKLFGFFVGQVMKESKGKANPKLVNELLKSSLLK